MKFIPSSVNISLIPVQPTTYVKERRVFQSATSGIILSLFFQCFLEFWTGRLLGNHLASLRYFSAKASVYSIVLSRSVCSCAFCLIFFADSPCIMLDCELSVPQLEPLQAVVHEGMSFVIGWCAREQFVSDGPINTFVDPHQLHYKSFRKIVVGIRNAKKFGL